MAGLFRFRRGGSDQSRSADASAPAEQLAAAGAGGAAGAPADGDLGTARSDGSITLDLAAPDLVDAAPAPAAGAAPSNALHEHSDPAKAATDGVWEVIRPAAIVPEHAARRVLVEMARRDLTNGGEWQSEPQLWSRYAGPMADPFEAIEDQVEPLPDLMGTIHVTYGTPTKYEITLYRVTVTAEGVAAGYTVASLTDEALGFGGLTLAECPRATMNTPPRPFTY